MSNEFFELKPRKNRAPRYMKQDWRCPFRKGSWQYKAWRVGVKGIDWSTSGRIATEYGKKDNASITAVVISYKAIIKNKGSPNKVVARYHGCRSSYAVVRRTEELEKMISTVVELNRLAEERYALNDNFRSILKCLVIYDDHHVDSTVRIDDMLEYFRAECDASGQYRIIGGKKGRL